VFLYDTIACEEMNNEHEHAITGVVQNFHVFVALVLLFTTFQNKIAALSLKIAATSTIHYQQSTIR